MRARIIIFTFALLSAQLHAQTDTERFELFNECRPMELIVEDLPDDAADIDLTEERIQTIAESRLRAARLYEAQGLNPFLSINVAVFGPTFNLLVEYRKPLYDPASDTTRPAITWTSGVIGTHGGDAGYILQALSEYLDRFVLQYLRVNEDSCGQ